MDSFMKKVIAGFILLMGVGFLITAIFLYKDKKEFASTAEKTTATVTEVYKTKEYKRVYRNGRRRRRRVTVYKTYFEYEANGEVFEDMKESSGRSEVGDTFTIWYDKNDPTHISMDASYGGAIFLAVGAVILILVGGVGLLLRYDKH